MRIQAVAFRGFAPFADGEIEFPASDTDESQVSAADSTKLGMVHLLTGQNGTGKTRLLSLMAAACGNPKDRWLALELRIHRLHLFAFAPDTNWEYGDRLKDKASILPDFLYMNALQASLMLGPNSSTPKSICR